MTKVETFARNIAEIGMRRLGKCVLKLICKHQDRKRTIRLRGEWVDMDPRHWDADMDVTINTGLGSGSRERDGAALQSVIMLQKEIAGQLMPLLGAENDVCGASQILHSAQKFIECTGLKGVEQFIGNLTPKDKEMILAKTSQSAPPNPKLLEIQAKAAAEEHKQQTAAMLDQQKAQFSQMMEQRHAQWQQQLEAAQSEKDRQLETWKMQKQLEIEKAQAQADAAVADREAQQRYQLAQQKFEFDKELALLKAHIDSRDKMLDRVMASHPMFAAPQAPRIGTMGAE